VGTAPLHCQNFRPASVVPSCLTSHAQPCIHRMAEEVLFWTPNFHSNGKR
jgi:hypothetical protein